MQPLFPEAPDPTGSECHQLVVGRVGPDRLPAGDCDRSNLVDPLIRNWPDQLRVAELPADRELDDKIRFVDVPLDFPLAVVHADVETHPWRPGRSCSDVVGDDAQVEVHRVVFPLTLDSLGEPVSCHVAQHQEVEIARARRVAAKRERTMHDDAAVRQNSSTEKAESLQQQRGSHSLLISHNSAA